MYDAYISSGDVIPGLPTDIQAAAKYLYNQASDAGYDAGQLALKALKNLWNVKGDPGKLDGGVRILRGDVAGAIAGAKTDIDLGMASFKGAWLGRGATAFTNYVPVLTAGIVSVQNSAITTATAIAQFRSALQQLWQDVITKTIRAGADVASAIAKVGGPKKAHEAVEAVMGIIAAFAGWAADLLGALMTLDNERFKASDKLGEADRMLDGLVKVSGPSGGKAASRYTGPTGTQLPMPGEIAVDPNWSAGDVKDRWKPGDGKVELDTQALSKLANTFRDNGEHWNTAMKRQIDASIHNLTADAFGTVGAKFYADVVKVMSRDYILYLHSDTRMDQLGNLLSQINAAYGVVDKDAGHVFSDLITNN